MISFIILIIKWFFKKYRSLKNPNKYAVFVIEVNDINDILYLCIAIWLDIER